MAAGKLEKVKGAPGIFRRHKGDCPRGKRCDCPFVVPRPTMKTYRTLTEARDGKALAQRQAKLLKAHADGHHRGDPAQDCPDCQRERAERERDDPLLHVYAREWIERYQGTGKRGFREETRDGYRTLLDRYALKFYGQDVRLSEITPRTVAEFIGWLVKRPNRSGGKLSDKSVRNALGPLAACLATARREGLIDQNPTVGAALPHRPRIEDDDDLPRPFPVIVQDGDEIETMELVVSLIHPGHRVMFELLAATGVRRSELLAFEGRHFVLNGDQPYVKVRQRAARRNGVGMVIGPLKSRHARRDLPIPFELADRLRALGTADDALAFESPQGGVYDPHHLHHRVLKPAAAEAGVEWAGFHTFRHTVASRMFARGRNVVQVQRWLGHHAASFTLDTYVHLLRDDLPEPLEPVRVNKRSTSRMETAVEDVVASIEDLAR